jgi:hypothetical protein
MLTMKKVQELLKKIGLSDQHINTILKEDADFDVDEVAGEVTQNIQQALENDDAFISKLKGNWQGEVLSSKERYLVKASKGLLTQAELEGLPKQDRFNKVVDLLVEKMGATAPNGDADKEIQRLRGELQQRDEAIRTLKEVELPGALNKATEVEAGFQIRNFIAKAASANNRKTVLPLEKTIELLYGDAKEQYDLKWNSANKQVTVYQKGKDLLAYGDKDKSKPLGIDDIIPSIGEAQGYFVKNNTADAGTTNVVAKSVDVKKAKYTLPGLDKARKHAEQTGN